MEGLDFLKPQKSPKHLNNIYFCVYTESIHVYVYYLFSTLCCISIMMWLYIQNTDDKMKLKERIKQRDFKKSMFNVLLGLIVTLGVYYLFKFTNASTETWTFLIVALLLIIYFELCDVTKEILR